MDDDYWLLVYWYGSGRYWSDMPTLCDSRQYRIYLRGVNIVDTNNLYAGFFITYNTAAAAYIDFRRRCHSSPASPRRDKGY